MKNAHVLHLYALGALAPTSLTSCIVQPANDDEITSRATPVGFVGFAQQNGEQIRLEARRPPDGAFVQFATATADGAYQYTQYGETLYSWNTTVAVPTARWEPGAVGYRTGPFSLFQTES